jgi:EAL domain-containing protein (putative c-di-GMP-specific phosphodiesterase class I)/FixJ family two-component response regulator
MAKVFTASSGARRSVLIFDDDAAMLALAKERFQREQCEVRTANDKSSFLNALTAKPELILLDLSLKDLDGIEAFSLIATHHPRVDILLFSGHSEEVMNHARIVGEQSGLKILGLLRKPFARRDVLKALALRSPERPPLDQELDRRDNTHLLDEAIEKGWLEFWYQPKVSLRTGDVLGAECLARIRHPDLGLLAPAVFLPTASEAKLFDLTKCALCDAARLGAELQRHPDFQLSINIAGSLLHRTDLLDVLLEISREAPRNRRLILELTETDFVAEPLNMQRFATRAVLNGFGISIDDFGHGYANFDRLRRTPFCELKIDRSVTAGCAGDPHLRTLCRAAVELAHGFKAEAVAEGVDNIDDLRILRELSFDIAQGYLFSRPVRRDLFDDIPQRYAFDCLTCKRDGAGDDQSRSTRSATKV